MIASGAARGAGTYRPDVDGMRALAVLLVIAHHFNSALAPGGFVGVDVFFVISGFVVTGSILKSSSGNAAKDVIHFWRRRFFRIFPVLLLFVAVTLLIISIFTPPYPPVPYNGSFRAGLFSLMGLSNIYIYRIGLDYFQDGAQNAFIHTWSLGVEEQFYVFYSLLFIALPQLLKFGGVTRLRVATLVGLGIVSLGLFLHGVRTAPMQAYYFLPHRFWELAAGGLIALTPAGLMWGARFRGLVIVLQVAAAAILLATAFIPFDPGGSPLFRIPFAVLATAVLILTGARAGAPVARLLTLRPVVFIGLISYSLYLWHWPVLLLSRSTIGLDSLWGVTAAVLLMSGLSVASWWFVETPWRRAPRAVLILPYAAALTSVVAMLAFASQAAPGRLYAGQQQDWARDWMPAVGFAWLGAGRVTAGECLLSDGAEAPDQVPVQCASGSSVSAAPRVLLLGDSLAAANWPMIAIGERQGDFQVSTLAHSGCSIQSAPATQTPSCAKYWAQAPSLVRNTLGKGDIVFVATLWSQTDLSPTGAAAGRLAAIAEAARSVGATTAVQAPLPHFKRATYTCTPEWFRLNYSGCMAPRANLELDRRRVLRMLDRLNQTETKLRIWDPFPLLCPGEACSQFASSGRPLFRDYTHLSAYGSTQLGSTFVAFVESGRDLKVAVAQPDSR